MADRDRRLFVARCHAVIWRCATEANCYGALATLYRERGWSAEFVASMERHAARWSRRCDYARRVLVMAGERDVGLVRPIAVEVHRG